MSKKKALEIPEGDISFDGLDIDAILDLRSQARSELSEIAAISEADVTEEQLQRGEDLARYMDAADARVGEMRAEQKARADRLKALSDAADEGDEDEEGDDDGDDDESDDTDDDAADEGDDEDEPAEVEEPALIASAAARAARNAPKPKVKTKAVAAITASAGAKTLPMGSDLNMGSLSAAIAERARDLPTTKKTVGQGANRRGVQSNRYNVGRMDFSTAREDGLTSDNPDFNDYTLLREAANPKRLKKGLVAGGGWCAPAETLYGMCQDATTDGILSLPSIQVSRGRLKFTKGTDFKVIFADADGDFHMTEAEVIAEEDPKPCITVECPDFDEEVLDATGICIQSGLLTRAGYPEQVQDFTEKVLIAHQHKVARRQYDRIVAGSLEFAMAGAITALDGLEHLTMLANYIRSANRWSENTVVEIPLPTWYRDVLRADFARRNGQPTFAVTDAMIADWFSVRQLVPQWLENLGQDLVATAGDPGDPTVLTVPATVSAVMYKAGTWVGLTTDIIDLGVLYDSTNLRNNTYTAVFAEEGIGLANMCNDSLVIEIPTFASGQTGAADLGYTVYEAEPEPEPEA